MYHLDDIQTHDEADLAELRAEQTREDVELAEWVEG